MQAVLTVQPDPARMAASSAILPLAMAPKGIPLEVLSCSGRDETRAHLARLGFVAGGEIRVVNEMAGNIIVEVKGARVALSRQLAHRIQVAFTS